MAFGGLGVTPFGRRIDRRLGIPVSLLAARGADDPARRCRRLAVFTALRIVQGVCMATAFTLTLAYLGERLGGRRRRQRLLPPISPATSPATLIGRLISAGVADHFGLAANFQAFAAAQPRRCRAGLVPCAHAARRMLRRHGSRAAGRRICGIRPLHAGFGIGFCILFAFIGTFTFVNFVLVRPPSCSA